ncbi:potassium channel subfamily K member 5 [Trichonephila clavata]|uniref:Potassium channel subfamily K member 5 n=1 Tax=Trichonephila clavata TaxID=2740835 RepID=A0A8X6KV91_TRICU|nr:potassium channel subfamily K member 5 [Trichonephila clavata]
MWVAILGQSMLPIRVNDEKMFPGQTIARNVYYFVYKIVLLIWMIHGLAFFSMTVDALCQVCKRFCLFSITYNWKTKKLSIFRVLIDIEKLDLHFRLLKSARVKHKEGVYHFKGKSERVKDYKQNHLRKLEEIAITLRGLILEELRRRGNKEIEDSFPSKERQETEHSYSSIRFSRDKDINSFSLK